MLYSKKSQFPINHWYMLSANLGFVHFRTKEEYNKLNNVFIGFLDHENIGLDTKIMSLRTKEPEILPSRHLESSDDFEFFSCHFRFCKVLDKEKSLVCSIMLLLDSLTIKT